MIYSMTGFAVAAIETEHGALNLELRSVNHRYLDIQFRLNEELRVLEPAMREAIGNAISRGKVDCRLNYSPSAAKAGQLQLNAVLLQQLVQLNQTVQAHLADSQSLSVAEILRWPGVLGAETEPAENLHNSCLALLQTALNELNATRGREGEKLKQLLLQRVEQMEQLVAEILPRIPELLAGYQEKLIGRLKEAGIGHDDERIRQEISLFAQKIDVDEELSRLRTHLDEVKRVLGRGGVIGKRLDFLMQELNREANTLGSKSVDAEMSQASMDMKVLIDQMREQIQNIE